MVGQVLSEGFHLARMRWKKMIVTYLVCLVPVVVVTLAVMLLGGLSIARDVQEMATGAQQAQAGAIEAAQTTDPAAIDPATGLPAEGLAVADAAQAPAAAPPKLTAGFIAKLIGFFVVFMGLIIAAVSFMYAAMIRAAVFDEPLGPRLRESLRVLIPQASQLSVAMLPYMAALIVATIVPSLALKVVIALIAVPLAVAGSLVGMLAIASTALGDRDKLPRTATRLVRQNKLGVFLTALTFGIASVFLMLAAQIVAMLTVVLFPLAIAVSAGVTLWGMCVAVSLFRACGGEMDADPLGGGTVPGDGSMAAAAPAATSFDQYAAAAAQPAGAYAAGLPAAAVAEAAVAAPVAAEPAAPVAGPTLEGVVQPGATHGEWLSVAGAGTVTLQLAWSEGEPLVLHVADQAQQWLAVDQPAQNGAAVTFEAVAGGWYWVNLTSQAAAAQSFRVASWAPAATAAA